MNSLHQNQSPKMDSYSYYTHRLRDYFWWLDLYEIRPTDEEDLSDFKGIYPTENYEYPYDFLYQCGNGNTPPLVTKTTFSNEKKEPYFYTVDLTVYYSDRPNDQSISCQWRIRLVQIDGFLYIDDYKNISVFD